MGIQGEPETVTRSYNEGTARIQIETPTDTPQGGWFIKGHRESYWTIDGVLQGKPRFEEDVRDGSRIESVQRSFAELAPDTVELEGQTYSGAFTAALIKAWMDKLRAEDIAAAAEDPAE